MAHIGSSADPSYCIARTALIVPVSREVGLRGSTRDNFAALPAATTCVEAVVDIEGLELVAVASMTSSVAAVDATIDKPRLRRRRSLVATIRFVVALASLRRYPSSLSGKGRVNGVALKRKGRLDGPYWVIGYPQLPYFPYWVDCPGVALSRAEGIDQG